MWEWIKHWLKFKFGKNFDVEKAPHEIIPNFINWEEGDKIDLDVHLQEFWYEGVVDNKLVLRNSRFLMSAMQRIVVYIEMTPREYMSYSRHCNLDLLKRQQTENGNRLKEQISNDSYNEFLSMAKQSLDELFDEYRQGRLK